MSFSNFLSVLLRTHVVSRYERNTKVPVNFSCRSKHVNKTSQHTRFDQRTCKKWGYFNGVIVVKYCFLTVLLWKHLFFFENQRNKKANVSHSFQKNVFCQQQNFPSAHPRKCLSKRSLQQGFRANK